MVTASAPHRAQGELRYERGYPPVVNTAPRWSSRPSAAEGGGEENADANYTPSMEAKTSPTCCWSDRAAYSVIGQGAGRAADRAAAQHAL